MLEKVKGSNRSWQQDMTFKVESLYKEVDDINYTYIDASNLKRFLIKTGIFPNDSLLISILRRFDLDADAKLSLKEFIEGVMP